MINFDIVVDNINELKSTEMMLFNLKLDKSVSGSIYVIENSTSYFYTTVPHPVGNYYTIVTQ